ncbi:MAG: hypothetical protein FWD68_03185 [Alphaproteobacteria bacterium]|nr:hypothetical protein [Alphaproteobacteria bacterium]
MTYDLELAKAMATYYEYRTLFLLRGIPTAVFGIDHNALACLKSERRANLTGQESSIGLSSPGQGGGRQNAGRPPFRHEASG